MTTLERATVGWILSAHVLLAIAAQKEVSFPVDESRITGDLYGAGTRGVVIVGHGGYSSRRSWEPEARAIADAGFHVLVFDTRAAAEFAASGNETPCFYDEVCQAVDVLAAVRYLRTRGATTIAVIGSLRLRLRRRTRCRAESSSLSRALLHRRACRARGRRAWPAHFSDGPA